jgi:large subunit ribosomal protein L18
MKKDKQSLRDRRRASIRATIRGTTERPRLVVGRTLSHMYAQVIDDTAGKTICAVSDLKSKTKGKTNRAKEVGTAIAKAAIEKKVSTIVFDRAGYRYHGRVKVLADAAREAGLKF